MLYARRISIAHKWDNRHSCCSFFCYHRMPCSYPCEYHSFPGLPQMKLLLRRSERTGALGGLIFVLDIRAELTGEETGWIAKYKLGDLQLYSRKARPDVDTGTVTGIGLLLLHHALNLTINVRDLVYGKKIECKNILEMLSAEAQVKEAAQNFGSVLRAASQFGGEEVVPI